MRPATVKDLEELFGEDLEREWSNKDSVYEEEEEGGSEGLESTDSDAWLEETVEDFTVATVRRRTGVRTQVEFPEEGLAERVVVRDTSVTYQPPYTQVEIMGEMMPWPAPLMEFDEVMNLRKTLTVYWAEHADGRVLGNVACRWYATLAFYLVSPPPHVPHSANFGISG